MKMKTQHTKIDAKPRMQLHERFQQQVPAWRESFREKNNNAQKE